MESEFDFDEQTFIYDQFYSELKKEFLINNVPIEEPFKKICKALGPDFFVRLHQIYLDMLFYNKIHKKMRDYNLGSTSDYSAFNGVEDLTLALNSDLKKMFKLKDTFKCIRGEVLSEVEAKVRETILGLFTEEKTVWIDKLPRDKNSSPESFGFKLFIFQINKMFEGVDNSIHKLFVNKEALLKQVLMRYVFVSEALKSLEQQRLRESATDDFAESVRDQIERLERTSSYYCNIAGNDRMINILEDIQSCCKQVEKVLTDGNIKIVGSTLLRK